MCLQGVVLCFGQHEAFSKKRREMNKSTRIGIVGGGPAGLTAAYYLEKEGYTNVTVFEKSGQVGGKCHTLNHDGRAYDMGAIMITKAYKRIKGLIEEFNLETTSFPYFRQMHHQDGTRTKYNKPKAKSVLRYLKLLSKYKHIWETPGFQNTPSELAQPFSSWLESNGISDLAELFAGPVFTYGYGRLDDIPAVYVLKYFNKGNTYTLFQGALWEQLIPECFNFPVPFYRRLTHGTQPLMTKIAETLHDVKLNSEITKISRDQTVQIEWKNGLTGVQERGEYDKLILSHPLESSTLDFLEKTSEEKRLFDSVTHNHYYTIACRMEGFGYNVHTEIFNKKGQIDIPPDGYPLQFFKAWKESDMCIFYAYSTHALSQKEIEKNLEQNIQDIGGKLIEIKSVQKWHYFPHVKSDAIHKGFYDELESLQGENHTYFNGALMNFELIENVTVYSNDLVHRFFK